MYLSCPAHVLPKTRFQTLTWRNQVELPMNFLCDEYSENKKHGADKLICHLPLVRMPSASPKENCTRLQAG